MTEILLNANACLPLMNSLLENISSKSDDNIDLYFKAFSDFKDEMQKYNNSLKLDMQFFKFFVLVIALSSKRIVDPFFLLQKQFTGSQYISERNEHRSFGSKAFLRFLELAE